MDRVILRTRRSSAPGHRADDPETMQTGGVAMPELNVFLHSLVEQFPGVALAAEFYLEGGIRSAEIGTLMFGRNAQMDMVRLAIPRRVYTQSHIEYVVEVILDVWRPREQIRGYEAIHQAPSLRHFTARLKPPNGRAPGRLASSGSGPRRDTSAARNQCSPNVLRSVA